MDLTDGVVENFDEIWTINLNEIRMEEVIGRGAFGEVKKGMLLGTPVAVKKITAQEEDDELYIMRELAVLKSMRHPNIVSFMGYYQTGPDLYIITEFVANGTLRAMVKNRDVELSWKQRHRIALDIACALAYLHSRNVIFRDLKSKNVLIDEYNRAKICDFGFARTTESLRGAKAMTLCGTDDWMAPEVILGMEYDALADVFSYGIVLFELITREKVSLALQRSPMDAFDLDEAKTRKLIQGTGCPSQFSDLAFLCCKYDPRNRPDFVTIVDTLWAMVDDMPDTPKKAVAPRPGRGGAAAGRGVPIVRGQPRGASPRGGGVPRGGGGLRGGPAMVPIQRKASNPQPRARIDVVSVDD